MQGKLRICILQTNLPSERVKSGGEERFTIGLAQSLAARHDVTIITRGEEEKVVTRGRLTIRYVKSTSLRFVRFFAYTRRLVKELGKIGAVDILQCNISDRSNGLAGAFFCGRRNIPLVTRVPGFDPPAEKLSWPHRKALSWIFGRSALVVSINSDFLVGEIRSIRKDCRIAVLPHGIDLVKMGRARKGAGKERGLLFVGRLVWFKNAGMLIRVMSMLKGKGVMARLCIIGTGPEEAKLKGMAKEYSVYDSIEFAGEVSNEEVSRRMGGSDVFVFPSKREPRGLVLIEAMAAGLPIVSVNRGGPKDIIAEGRNGFLVEPDDDGKMAERITSLLSDRKLYGRVSKNNVRDVGEYSWDKVCMKWEEAYFSVLRNSGGGRKA